MSADWTDDNEGHRYYGAYEEHLNEKPSSTSSYDTEDVSQNQNPSSYLSNLNNDVIGNYKGFSTPYGMKPMIYTDWTASGRALNHIETYLRDNVLPYYGNTVSLLNIVLSDVLQSYR